MRIMGLDYGAKTVGIAMSDELLLTAQPCETVFREKESRLRRTLARIETLAREGGVTKIVLGLPVHMDGSMSSRAEKTLEFKAMLERRTGLPVLLQDERLTTVEASEILTESGIPKSEQKAYIDKIAASFILNDYLESIRQERPMT